VSYADLLKDPRWQRRRLEVFQRDNFTCQSCGSTEKSLQVHHQFYLKGYMPWDYEPAMLVTLCEECHELAGALIDRLRVALAHLRPRHIDRAIGYIDALVGEDEPDWAIPVRPEARARGVLDATAIGPWWIKNIAETTDATCIVQENVEFMRNADREDAIDQAIEDILP